MDKKKEKMVWDAVMEEMQIFDWQEWLHPKIGLEPTEYTKKRVNSIYVVSHVLRQFR